MATSVNEFEDAAESDSSDSQNGEPSKVNTRPRSCKKISVSTIPSDFYKIKIKVPPFSPDDPEIWFALLEGQFETRNITDDADKFSNVVTNLDLQHAKAVKDIIIKPPLTNRYEKIKSELIRRLSASNEKKVKQLLTHEELGDRKPSQFLRHLQDLAGPSVPENFIRSIWSNRLPSNIQTVLASQTTQSLDQLSDLADRIQEITLPSNVAATSFSTAVPSSPLSEIAELRKMVERLAVKLDEHTRRSDNRSNDRSYDHSYDRSNDRSDRSRSQNRRSSSRQRSRSRSNYEKYPLCWYHSRHGAKAHHCIKPCDFHKAGNSTGSR